MRNDKVKLAVVTFMADSFRPDATASDAEVAAYFDAHPAEFTVPEKRKVRYLLVDIDALRAKVVDPGGRHRARVQRRHPAVFDARTDPCEPHLLRTEGKDEAAVKAEAEDLLKQARAGADFAELATQAFRRRGEREERRGPRLFRPGPDGAGVRSGRLRDGVGADQRSGQDPVRVPHHQGRRQEAGNNARAGRCAATARRTARLREGAGPGCRSRADDRARGHQPGGPGQSRAIKRVDRAGDRDSSRGTGRLLASAPRRKRLREPSR